MAKKIFLRVGWFFDGSGKKGQKDMLLSLDGGLITGVERYSEDLGITPESLRDLSHCTILPPLVDSHLHLFMSGTTDEQFRRGQLDADYEQLRPVIQRHLRDLFNHGVLAVRDGGDRGGFALGYCREDNDRAGVLIKNTGRAWHQKGRYGSLIGRCPGEGQGLADGFRAQYRGEDSVKLVNSGLNSLDTFGKTTPAQFAGDEIGQLVAAANERGLGVMVHANGVEGVRGALEAGCRSIEHGFFMGDENLKRMADLGVFWVPTVYTMKAYLENIQFSLHGGKSDVVQKNIDHQLEQLQKARAYGVKIALGTDAGSLGVLHGEAVAEEMKLYRKAGFELHEILHSCCANGAELLGEGGGVLGPGASATFLVARGVPQQLLRKIQYLEAVYVGGCPSPNYRKNPHKIVH